MKGSSSVSQSRLYTNRSRFNQQSTICWRDEDVTIHKCNIQKKFRIDKKGTHPLKISSRASRSFSLSLEQLKIGIGSRLPTYADERRLRRHEETNSLWLWIIKLFPARESLVSDTPTGDGKIDNLFYSVPPKSGQKLLQFVSFNFGQLSMSHY